MAGVGKLLKQAQKMQKRMQEIEEELKTTELEVSSGGGAVQVKITGQPEFKAIKIDPEFLQEDADFVEETLLGAVQEAMEKANALREEKMGEVTSGFGGGIPGLM